MLILCHLCLGSHDFIRKSFTSEFRLNYATKYPMALIYPDVTVTLLCVQYILRVYKNVQPATGVSYRIRPSTLIFHFQGAVCTEKQELNINKNFLLLKF
jgi:hypothetical protein